MPKIGVGTAIALPLQIASVRIIDCRGLIVSQWDGLKRLGLGFVGSLLGIGCNVMPIWAQTDRPSPVTAEDLDLSPEIIEESPVLQRWLQEVPDVLEDIRTDPSFRTRVRLGYSQFPSTDDASGFNVGVEDLFFGGTGLTLSGDYQASGNGDRTSGGAQLRYYLLPLGNYVNIAPVVGFRHLETEAYSTNGLELGGRLMLSLSRGGAGDVSLGYSQVGIGGDESVGLASFSVGYAVSRNVRLATDLQWQIADGDDDTRVGVVLELMP